MNFLEAHGRSYGYIYCVSPVSKLPTKPQNCRALPSLPGVRGGGSASAEPVGLCFQIRALCAHLNYSLFTCRRSLRVTDEVIFKFVCSRRSQSASKKPMRSSSPSLSQRKSSLSSLPSLMRSRFSTCFESIGSVILPRIAAARQSPRSMPW